MRQFEQRPDPRPLTTEMRGTISVKLVTKGLVDVLCIQGQKMPAGTIKSCWVVPAIEALHAHGLVPHAGIGEASSGCTAKAAAYTCERLRIPFTAYLPRGTDSSVISVVEKHGGRVITTPAARQVDGAVKALTAAVAATGLLALNQFVNPENPNGVAENLIPVLRDYLDPSRPVIVVVATGTGGSLVGLTRGLRDEGFQASAVQARPVTLDGRMSYSVRGVRESPPNFFDQLVKVEREDIEPEAGYRAARELRRRGFAVGDSSGINWEAATRVAARNRGAQVVTVFHDGSTSGRSI